MIANDSGLPIRDVTVEATLHVTSQKAVDIVVLPTGRYFVQRLGQNSWDYPAELEEFDRRVRAYTRTERYRMKGLTFTDAGGARWSIDVQGA